MNKLNKLYEAMLKSWGCSFTEDHAIVLNMGGVEVPVKVDDKQTYLPTSENLNGVVIGKVFFHPACESIMSKETEIFKVIRKLSAAKIFAVFQPIFNVIVEVANKKSGKTLNGKTLEQLEPFKNISKAAKAEVIEIIRSISITIEDSGIDTRLIHFSMIKGGKTDNDETAYYTAVPSFPFYTELYRAVSQNDHVKPAERLSFNNLNVSMQALRTVIALFELAMPAVIDPSRKKYSSTIADAARLTAYLHSYALVAADMNSLIGKFRKEFDSIGIYGIDLEWVNDLDEIGEIKSLIPSLDYNNYNLTSSPETPAANSGARISSYNPMAGVFNPPGNNTGNNNQSSNVTTQQRPGAPKTPEMMNGETYLGSDYSEVNGVYEFRFQQPSGMIRVRCLAEDGRFITENIVAPQMNPQQQFGMGNMMGNNLMQQQAMQQAMMLRMAQGGMMGSGIPMLGLGGGMTVDPYTGLPIANNQNGIQPNNGMAQNNGLGQVPTNTIFGNGMGTAGINDY